MVEARNRSNKSNKKSVKSKELRKYEVAYNKCIKLCLKSKRCKKSAKRVVDDLMCLNKSRKRRKSATKKSRKRSKKLSKSSTKKSRKRSKKRSKSRSKRRLNAYQKFVKRESAKSVYRGKSVKSRMCAIAKLWKKSKH